MSNQPSSAQSNSKTQIALHKSIWPTLCFVFVFLNGLAFSWNPLMGGDDFWAHAAIGWWTIENRVVPRESLFLWTAHIKWIFHAYGSGVVFAALLKTGGPLLALLFNAFASVLPFALIWFWWRKHRSYATIFSLFLLIAIWISSARWHLRPEIFTVNFLTLLFLFFLREKRPLWLCSLIVAMFAIWPSMHGGCLMGIVVIWGTAVTELIQDRKKGLATLLLAAICTVAIFVGSPYHLSYATTWKSIGDPIFLSIDEWKPFWWDPILGIDVVIGIFLVWGTAFFLWFKSPEKKLTHLIWLLLFGLAFLQARRQLWLVSIASILVIAIYAEPLRGENLLAAYNRLLKRVSSQSECFVNIARYGALVILLCSLFAAATRDKKPFAIYDSKFPHGMSEYLLTRAPAGRMFNDYEYSASLQWILYGKREFYIDLINAYPVSILKEYFQVLSASSEGRAILDKRKIDIVALRPRKEKELMNDLVAYLDSDPRWHHVYDGVDGDIWIRNTALKNRNLAKVIE